MSFTPVAQRVMNEFDWSNIAVMIKKKQFPQINSDRLLEEFKKFLLIKFIDRDIDGNMYSPSFFVDEVWHIFMLFPKDYYGMCTKILNGEVLDHNPLKQGVYAESQPVRYQRMLDRYNALYAMPPPQPYWEVPVSAVETIDNPSPTYSESSSTPATSEVTPNKKRAKTSQSSNDATLIVRTLTGKVLSFRMPLSTSIDEVKVKIQEVDGSPTCQQRLVFQGRQLEDGLTLSDYNVTSNDTIHMVLNLRGC